MNSSLSKRRIIDCPARLVAIVLYFTACCSFASGVSPEQLSQLRTALEHQYKQTTGVAFKSFSCDVPSTWPKSREFVCDMIDSEGDAMYYRMMFDQPGSPPRFSTTQPVDQLNPEGFATLRQPADEFLDAFAKSDWAGAYETLSAGFREGYSLEQLSKELAPIRVAFGKVSAKTARLYATPVESLHQLEYELSTDAGLTVARFRLRIDQTNTPSIVAFLLTASPGSDLQAKLLTEVIKPVLGKFFDQPIVGVEGPLGNARYIGDVIFAKVVLQDGNKIDIRMEQTSTSSDIDRNDYAFQILDAPMIISSYLAGQSQKVKSVKCPSVITPDGGEQNCKVSFESGTKSSYTIARRGGEHRLLQSN